MGFNSMTTPELKLTNPPTFTPPPDMLLAATLTEPYHLSQGDTEAGLDAVRKTIGELQTETESTCPDVPLLTRTRESRREVESMPPSDHPVHRFMKKPILWGMTEVSDIVEWGIELFPIRFIWGPGDILSLYMGLQNKNPLTGEKIDKHDARLHVIAACVPFLPSKAIIGPTKMIRKTLEEGHHFLRTGDSNGIKQTITLKNGLKLLFSII